MTNLSPNLTVSLSLWPSDECGEGGRKYVRDFTGATQRAALRRNRKFSSPARPEAASKMQALSLDLLDLHCTVYTAQCTLHTESRRFVRRLLGYPAV